MPGRREHAQQGAHVRLMAPARPPASRRWNGCLGGVMHSLQAAHLSLLSLLKACCLHGVGGQHASRSGERCPCCGYKLELSCMWHTKQSAAEFGMLTLQPECRG